MFDAAARLHPERIAIEEAPGGSITYRDLAALSDEVRDVLRRMGIGPGDRVGIYLRKSIDAVAAILGVLKAGAAYVPVDAAAPAWRSAYILADCAVRVVVLEEGLADAFTAEVSKLVEPPRLLLLPGVGGGESMRAALARVGAAPLPEWYANGSNGATVPARDHLAYVLYTSGSTGKPKGVMLTHGNALSFVDWCSEVFAPGCEDRFSSHAPFHFDLSILDLFVPLKHGATVVLIAAEAGREPLGLAALVSERRLTVWYSTPTILSLLAQYGRLERYDYSALRLVLFAGEVFPVKHLRRITAHWPAPRYFNLYGPTETNVCTYFELPRTIADDRVTPYPIGRVCSHLRGRVVDERGAPAPTGMEGELQIAGAGVMRGYWNLAEQTERAFAVDADGTRWYRTGDIVQEQAGELLFVGRRDRMVKRRGHRIELGEIEAGLYRHPAVREAAVVASTDEDSGVRITAYLSCRDGERPTIVELKRFCAETLPGSMVPDRFALRDALPRTSTDKIDYQHLAQTG